MMLTFSGHHNFIFYCIYYIDFDLKQAITEVRDARSFFLQKMSLFTFQRQIYYHLKLTQLERLYADRREHGRIEELEKWVSRSAQDYLADYDKMRPKKD
jgi:hypothetical protein